jgi:hypothetical protein
LEAYALKFLNDDSWLTLATAIRRRSGWDPNARRNVRQRSSGRARSDSS